MNRIRLLGKYLRYNGFFTLFFTYEFIACILKITTGINITIPCLITLVFGFHCFGCGLTSAFIELVKLNPANAWEHNPLIFVVIPGGVFYLIQDFLRFNKRVSKPAYSN